MIGRFVFYAAATLSWMEAAAQSDRGRVRWTCDVFASQMETGGLQTLVHEDGDETAITCLLSA